MDENPVTVTVNLDAGKSYSADQVAALLETLAKTLGVSDKLKVERDVPGMDEVTLRQGDIMLASMSASVALMTQA